MFVAERAVGHAGVLAHAQDQGVLAGKFVFEVGEFHRLDGASGGVVLGVEVHDHVVPADEVPEVHHPHIGIGNGKFGGLVSRFQHRGVSVGVVVFIQRMAQNLLRNGGYVNFFARHFFS